MERDTEREREIERRKAAGETDWRYVNEIGEREMERQKERRREEDKKEEEIRRQKRTEKAKSMYLPKFVFIIFPSFDHHILHFTKLLQDF